MLDVVRGLAAGKALDINNALALEDRQGKVIGSEDYQDIADAGIAVVTAGIARQPGMTREDLLKRNAVIVKEVTGNLKRFCKDEIIIAVVTNPLDIMTYFAWKESEFSSNHVFGIAGTLDSARFNMLIAEELKISPAAVRSIVIGSHGSTMLPLPRFSTALGIGINELIPEPRVQELVTRAKGLGTELVELLARGSAYYGPAAAIYEVVNSIVKDEKRLTSASAILSGEYGLSNLSIGVPVKIGKEGIEEIIELDLEPREKDLFLKSAEEIKKNIALVL